MLRSAGIRSKILAVLVIPLVLLAVTAGLLASGQVSRARGAVEVALFAAASQELATLLQTVEAERDVTVTALGRDEAAAALAAESLPAVRGRVDAALASVDDELGAVRPERVSPEAVIAFERSADARQQIPFIRSQVDGSGQTADVVATAYNRILAEDLALAGRVGASVEDSAPGRQLVGYGEVLSAASFAREEKTIGLRVLDGSATVREVDRLQYLTQRQDDVLASWSAVVGDNRSDALLGFVGMDQGWSTDRARDALVDSSSARGLAPEVWSSVAGQRVGAMESELSQVSREVTAAADASRQEATLFAAVAVGAVLFGVGITIALSILMARRITLPLRRLIGAADEARAALPVMVEQMRTPGAMPDVSLPHIEVDGDDEVARLARAFNAVNTTVIEVAEKQAVLRGAIAETFVNVARRNQVLLSRQLAFIDQLERKEEDPDTLENLFRLDHLATRMRRNAESLLVLAGIEAGRRLRRPLPLSDVIRTAAAEIEQYERVNLALQVDPPTMGHLSLQTAHLLAELLENATNFSEPHTPVLVATSQTDTGIRVVITDEGLGLTAEEIDTFQTKIRDTGSDEVVTSQRLGFFVVGRLAARLGVTVTLKRGRSKGLVVVVDLPPAMFVPGSVTTATPTSPAAAALAGAPGDERAALPAGQAAPAAHPADAPAATQVARQRPPEPRPAPSRPAAPAAPAAAGGGAGSGHRYSTRTPPVQRPVPGQSIPLPGAALTDAPAPAGPVRVATGSAPLPRRGQASSAVTSSAPVPAPATAPIPVPVPVPVPVSSVAPTEAVAEVAVESGDPDGTAPPRRAGLFGAFRARRGEAEPASTTPAAQGPATRVVPPTGASPLPASLVSPEVPSGVPTLQGPTGPTGPLPSRSASAASRTRAASADRPEASPASEALPAPAPAVERAPATAPAAAKSEPPPRSAPNPVDILPGGRGRRARPSLFGRGQAPTTAESRSDEVSERTVPLSPSAMPHMAPAAGPAAPLARRPLNNGSPTTQDGPSPRGASATGKAEPADRTMGEGRTGQDRTARDQHGAAPSDQGPVGGLRTSDPQDRQRGGPSSPEVGGDDVRQRSMLASEALSELSRLSTYSPSAVEGQQRPAPLTRRQPVAAAPEPVQSHAAPERRQRSATDVRSMLAGFQSGVSRGRAANPDDGDAPLSRPGLVAANATTPTRTDPTRTDPTRTDPTRTDPTRTDPTRTDPTGTFTTDTSTTD